jgi:hypothetical protein
LRPKLLCIFLVENIIELLLLQLLNNVHKFNRLSQGQTK